MTVPTIETVFPADEQEGVVLGVTIWWIMDQEIDPTTVARAFLVESPDSDRWTGPDLIVWDRSSTPEADYYLDSPGYKGILQGTFSYEKLNAAGDSVSSPTYSPGASAFKTKVIFTPTDVLAPSREYRVYLAGDEQSSDDVKVGIATRTVGDTELGSNLGAGTAYFTGGYNGSIEDIFNVEIQVGGDAGTASYTWWRNSNPLDIRTGVVSENEVHLINGVYVAFDQTGYEAGDSFRTSVVPPIYMTTTYTWNFTTGSGSITEVPSTTSTSIIGDIGTPISPVVFEVESSSPTDGAVRVPRTRKTFTVTFTKDLATLTADQVIVDLLPVTGLYDENEGNLNIPKILTVSGNVLNIEI